MHATTLRTDGINALVTMLPVSAGDATLIVWSDGATRRAVLIDAGLRENDALSYLQSIGIFHLDLIILSHPDLDHLGGLPAIMRSRSISVDRIWCFDLAFLREFIRTGTIPRPRPATREVRYDYALRSTLDEFSDILKTANVKGVQVLQVSEGHKLCLGGILLEVLYPPESLYRALHNPIAIKRMLDRRSLPEEWKGGREEREDTKAWQLSSPEQQERLTEMVERPEVPQDGVHLSDLPEEYEDEQSEEEDKGSEVEPEQLPWKMVGRLYNNLSIVVKATILGGITSPSILFPGDLSDWTTLVLRQWYNLRSDILKLPHHGSKTVTCDLKAIRDAMDGPYGWHWFLARDHPFPSPFYGPASWAALRQFYHSVEHGDPLPVLRDLVNPSHVLVFPDPWHRLPSMQLEQFRSHLIANRANRTLSALSDPTNMPSAARILLGLERRDITEI